MLLIGWAPRPLPMTIVFPAAFGKGCATGTNVFYGDIVLCQACLLPARGGLRRPRVKRQRRQADPVWLSLGQLDKDAIGAFAVPTSYDDFRSDIAETYPWVETDAPTGSSERPQT